MLRASRRAGGAISVFTALAFLVPAAPAFGHAALVGSEPKDGAQLSSIPESVLITYAEPPTQSSQFAVIDGCDRDVAASIEVLNDTIEATIADAQPGQWTVRWAVVSAVDGHLTRDRVRFSVDGEPDCTAAGPDEEPPDRADPVSSVPIAPIAIATGVILAVAIGVRVMSRPKEGQ
jgi:methionine-rich copper-binding protein CopC